MIKMINNRENVPAIIQDMIQKLFDERNPMYIRDNYKRTLMDIRDYCNEAVSTFEKQTVIKTTSSFKKKKVG